MDTYGRLKTEPTAADNHMVHGRTSLIKAGLKELEKGLLFLSFTSTMSSGGGEPAQTSLFEWPGRPYCLYSWLTDIYRSVDLNTIRGKCVSREEIFLYFVIFFEDTHTVVFPASFLPGKLTHPVLSCFHLPHEPKEIKCLGGTLCQIKHLSICITSFYFLPDSFRSFSQSPPVCVCAPFRCLTTDCFSSPAQIPSLAQNCVCLSGSVKANTLRLCTREKLQGYLQLNLRWFTITLRISVLFFSLWRNRCKYGGNANAVVN